MAAIQLKLQIRRRELGMSYSDLAARSGVSVATVKRIFTGDIAAASLKHVAAVAEAMGLALDMHEDSSSDEFREQAAVKQVDRLLRMVLGTSALEAQPVSARQKEKMKRDAVRRLLVGSSRRLWAP
jgi:transcriptional regulator with XRE-family HTH domain